VKLRMLALGVGCAVVAGCGGVSASPASAPQTGLEVQLDPPPVHALIGHHADLELSSEQIEELDAVGQEIHAATHPLLMQLRAVDESRNREEAQAHLLQLAGQIHLNNQRAMERVRGVLDEEQRDRACSLWADKSRSARGLRAMEVADSPLHPSTRSAQVYVASQRQNGAFWSWCSEPGGQTAAR